MPITSQDIVPFNKAKARSAFHLALLQDAIKGLERIRAGEPGIPVEEARVRSQARLDAARAACMTGA